MRIYYKYVKILPCEEIKGKYYVYKVEFPDAINNGIAPYYYGRRTYKGDILKDNYIGSPLKAKSLFLEQINKKNKITKEIIQTFSNTVECSVFEKGLIEEHYKKEGCLNGSIFSATLTKEQMAENGKKAYALGLGKLSNEERKRIQKEGIIKKIGSKNLSEYFKTIGINGGKKGGKKSYENKSGLHDLKNKKVLKGREKGRKVIAEKYAKKFAIVNPEGKLIKAKNLKKFCRENNLNRGNIKLLLKGKIKSSLGWTRPNMPR